MIMFLPDGLSRDGGRVRGPPPRSVDREKKTRSQRAAVTHELAVHGTEVLRRRRGFDDRARGNRLPAFLLTVSSESG